MQGDIGMKMPWSGSKEGKKSRKQHQGIADFLFNRAKMHWWLLGVICLLAVVWTVFPMESSRRLLNAGDFKLGERSPRDVFAQVDAFYDKAATEEEKQMALAGIPPVFDLDFQTLGDAGEEFKIIRNVRADDSLTDAEKVAKMKRLLYTGLILTDEVGLILATASDDQIDAMEDGVLNVLSDILADGVIAGGDDGSFVGTLLRIDYIKPEWERIKKRLEIQSGQRPANTQIASQLSVTLVDKRSEPSEEKTVSVKDMRDWSQAKDAALGTAMEMPEPINTVVMAMSVALMRPNLTYNPDLTEKLQEDMLSNFPVISQEIRQGDMIVGVGEPITESVERKLKAVSSAQKRAAIRAVPGAVIITALLAFVLIVYLRRYESSIFSEPRKIIALNLAILLILIIGDLFISWKPTVRLFVVWGPELEIQRPGFFVPAALASVIVAMLSNVQLAIVITCVIGVFVAMLAGVNLTGSLEYFLVVLAGGTAAAISASRARHRRHLMIAGLYTAGVNAFTILGLGFMGNISLVNVGTNCLIGAMNGIMVAVLTPGLLPIFEYLSKTTTDMELLELADLNQPLLTQLKEKASGSYYHSIDVAKLAEAAAEAIGANPLLVRVGSYYHDIGKISKPEYFIENQKGENIHDNLNPNMSVRVIASHVKEGVNVAKEHKLPQAVVDIIQQYHGTGLIGGKSFYQKAKEADRHDTVRLEDYRYPGPRPQTKEAAIVLLADSVESARHVVLNGNPTYSRLVSFVREIIEGKIMDSQLDECDLTLRDINLIADALAKVLSGMYHTRVEYPKAGD